jgi:WD40 repeat protein
VTHTLETPSPSSITTLTLGSVRAMSQGGANLARNIYAGSSDGNIYIWSFCSDDIGRIVSSISQDKTFIGHKAPITATKCIWLGIFKAERVVSADEGGTVIVWNISGQIIHKFEAVYGVRSLSADRVRIADSGSSKPDYVTIMAGCKAGVRAWKIHQNRESAWRMGNVMEINRDSALEVFGAEKREFETETTGSSWSDEWDSPTEGFDDVKSRAETANVLDSADTEQATTTKSFVPNPSDIIAIQFETSRDSERDLWIASGKQVIRLHRKSTWQAGTVLQHSSPVQHMLLSEGWNVVVTSSADNNVKVWDSGSGTLLREFSVDGDITGLIIVDLDRWKGIVSCDSNGKIWRWSYIPETQK